MDVRFCCLFVVAAHHMTAELQNIIYFVVVFMRACASPEREAATRNEELIARVYCDRPRIARHRGCSCLHVRLYALPRLVSLCSIHPAYT